MEHISKAQIKLIRSLQQKKFRDQLGLFVAEGDKCINELSKGFALETLVREGENATRSEIEQMSGLRTPQGSIAVFKKAQWSDGSINRPIVNRPIVNDLVLALDGIQDPGNLGTIIRTCDWFGVHDIFCSLDTADCYNPKVVQATMGALTRVRLHYVDLVEWLSAFSHQHSDIRIYGTLLEGKDMYEVLSGEASGVPANLAFVGRASSSEEPMAHRASLSPRTLSAIVMGNEGNGISPAVRQLITHPIRIPSYPKDAETSESLNVAIATAIVLAEFRRE